MTKKYTLGNFQISLLKNWGLKKIVSYKKAEHKARLKWKTPRERQLPSCFQTPNATDINIVILNALFSHANYQ